MSFPKTNDMNTPKDVVVNTETTSNIVSRTFDKINWKEFACGFGAAFINISVTYPINKVIFRQMLHGVNMRNAFSQIKQEGVYFLYRGMLPPLCQKTVSMAIMFGVYDECLRPLLDYNVNPYLAKSIAGLVAGTTEAFLCPFERIQTILSDTKHHSNYRNTFHAFKSIFATYGFREYYRGMTPILWRNGPSNACFFILREQCQNQIPASDSHVKTTVSAFICGATIGALISTLFYPLNVIKIGMQQKLGGNYESTLQVYLNIYHARGDKLRYIYHGAHMNSTRALISWGVINAAYENLKLLLY